MAGWRAAFSRFSCCAVLAWVAGAAGYANAVLTPNGMEFKRLAGKLGVDPDAPGALEEVASRLAGRRDCCRSGLVGRGRPGSMHPTFARR